MNIVTKQNLCISSVGDASGEFLNSVSSVKILGVMLSDDMRWNLHIDIISKVSKRLFILRFLRKANSS